MLVSPRRGPSLRGRRAFARFAVIAAIATLAGGVALVRPRTHAGDVRAPEMPPDTTVVYGPQSFATNGTTATFVERLGVTPSSGTHYALRVENGPPGESPVSSGSVVVNGQTLVSSTDLAGGAAVVTRELDLTGADTMTVTLSGSTGAALRVSVLATASPLVVVFGDKPYTITGGTTLTASDTITVPTGVGAPFYLFVNNGHSTGAARVSSGTVALTGAGAQGQATIDSNVGTDVEQVTVGNGSILQVSTTGAVGDVVTVRVAGTDIQPPTITLTSPAPGGWTNQSQATISGTIQDLTPTTVTVNGVAATVSGSSFSASVPLATEGANTLNVVATDAAGNATDSTWTVNRDTQAPTLTVANPVDSLYSEHGAVNVNGQSTDLNGVSVRANGTRMDRDSSTGNYLGTVYPLPEGLNYITVTATDPAGNATSVTRRVFVDFTPPTLTVDSPSDGALTRLDTIRVSGTASDASPLQVSVNGVPFSLDANGAFSGTTPLAVGANTITVVATDAAGRQTTVTRTVTRDTTPPSVTLSAPTDGRLTRYDTVTVRGTVLDENEVSATVNNLPAALGTSGELVATASLAAGTNIVTVVATDGAGNSATASRTVVLDADAPVITVASPADGSTTDQSQTTVNGTVSDASAVTLTVNGVVTSLASTGAFSAPVTLAEGSNAITLVATDAAGNSRTDTLTVTRATASGDQAPPALTSIATPIDRTVPSNASFGAGTAFLYNAAQPVQTGVAAGAIDSARAAVVRGRVVNSSLAPLPGVTVTVSGHPELGSTETRSDGWYDLVVNGGGEVTLRFTRDSYLPANRQADVPWRDFAVIDDVVLLQPDTIVTRVDLTSSEIQVAQSSVVADASGSRQATVMIKPGTTALLTMPDGSTQPASTLDLRITEFTVGPHGPAAMPAPLPPSTAYTYAVQLTADQTVAAGASSVVLSQPVSYYVDDFLGFDVGTAVPVGHYDAGVGAWVPDENGRTIQVLATTDGIATVDLDGDGIADPDSALTSVGLDLPERQQLATLYPAGKKLWRVRMLIPFLPEDLNHAPGLFGSDPAASVTPGCTERSSDLVSCELQTAGQSVPVTGAPFELAYNSNRAPGFGPGRTLKIDLTGATISDDLKEVELKIEVAGRRFTQKFEPAPNLTYTFAWDGRDAYGRLLQGGVPATVSVGHVYPTGYAVPPAVNKAFGLPCDQVSATDGRCLLRRDMLLITADDSARNYGTRWQTIKTTLGGFDATAQGFGGFTPSVLNVYDPVAQVMYAGDGRKRVGKRLPNVVSTVAGTGADAGAPSTSTGDGGPAKFATFSLITGMATGPDGSVYIVDATQRVVRRVRPDGVIVKIAGSQGLIPSTGDGGPATSLLLVNPQAVALGPDGSVYISDYAPSVNSNRVIRVTPDGIAHYFAGAGVGGYSGDGGPAKIAKIERIWAMAVASDGSVYLSDFDLCVVRRVGPDGIIRTVVRRSPRGFSGDGGPAVQAQLDNLAGVALGPDGSIYVAANARVRRVTPDGIIRTIAGNGVTFSQLPVPQYAGVDALTATLLATGSIAVDADGTVYVTSTGYIQQITPDGRMTTISGKNGVGSAPDGTASLNSSAGGFIALNPDHQLLLAEFRKVRTISAPFPGMGVGGMAIASPDGAEVYEFSPTGRHVRTRDATDGHSILEFSYDTAGRLQSIREATGKVTTIERDSTGRATAVVAPNGQRTALQYDALGQLSGTTAPDSRSVQFVLDENGLLKSTLDPSGQQVAGSQYDTDGRLVASTNALGGLTTYTAAGDGLSSALTVVSPTGQTSTVRSETLPGGVRQVTSMDPSGLSTRVTTALDGTVTTLTPDGRTTTLTSAPDPLLGLQAPVTTTVVKLPSGLTKTIEHRRTVVEDSTRPGVVLRAVDSTIVNGRVSVSTYDAATRTETIASAVGRQSLTQFDSLGRAISASIPGVAATALTYDDAGRVTSRSTGDRITSLVYDELGHVDHAANAVGDTVYFASDDVGRLTRRTAGDGGAVDFGYNARGDRSQVTPPGRPAHLLGRGPLGILQSYTAPSVGDGPTTITVAYESAGRIRTEGRADGSAVTTSYDAAGRYKSIAFPDGESRQFSYDSASGALTSIQSSGGIDVSYAYDGGLPTEERWTGSVSGSVATTYDRDFRPSSQSINGANKVNFTYDADGLTTGAGALAITYDSTNGAVSRTTLGTITTAQSYTSRGELGTFEARVDTTRIYALSLSYDAAGRIVARDETVAGQPVHRDYVYDRAGRLTTVRTDSVVTEAYEYDSNGNRTSATTASGSANGTVNAQDRLTGYGPNLYVYTADGERRYKIVGADTTAYTYDAHGNLKRVRLPDGTQVEYLVDGTNRRVGRRVNGQVTNVWLYDGQLAPIAELNGSGQVVCRYVYATRLTVPDYATCGSKTYRLIADERGSVILAVDTQSGAVALQRNYDAFGRVTSDSRPGFLPFGYAGGVYDSLTGLTRFGARDYDADSGRWTNRDPMGFEAGDANLYAYAGNDPVDRTDPTGLETLSEEQADLVIRNGLEDQAQGQTRLVIRISRQLGCWAIEQVQQQVIVEGLVQGYIYIFADVSTGGAASYVGQTVDLVRRAREHELAERLVGRFRSVFEVAGEGTLREAEQLAINQTAKVFGLAASPSEALLRKNGGLANTINALNKSSRAELHNSLKYSAACR